MNRTARRPLRPSTSRKTTMKAARMLRVLGLTGLGSVAAVSAMAQEAGYYYGGLSIGQSRARIDDERITAGLLGAGLQTTAMSLDESDTAFKIFGGEHHRSRSDAGAFAQRTRILPPHEPVQRGDHAAAHEEQEER